MGSGVPSCEVRWNITSDGGSVRCSTNSFAVALGQDQELPLVQRHTVRHPRIVERPACRVGLRPDRPQRLLPGRRHSLPRGDVARAERIAKQLGGRGGIPVGERHALWARGDAEVEDVSLDARQRDAIATPSDNEPDPRQGKLSTTRKQGNPRPVNSTGPARIVVDLSPARQPLNVRDRADLGREGRYRWAGLRTAANRRSSSGENRRQSKRSRRVIAIEF
jgi:hypothetical protein